MDFIIKFMKISIYLSGFNKPERRISIDNKIMDKGHAYSHGYTP